MLAGEAAADVVVGGHEADVVLALQTGVEDDDGNLALHRAADGSDEGGVVEGRERDAGDAASDRVLDFGHLRVAVVLAKRSAPRDGDPEFRRRLFGTGVDALPERV